MIAPTPDIRTVFGLQLLRIAGAEALNRALIAGFERLREAPETRRSHLFGGRYENIYPPRAALPEIEPLIALVEETATGLLTLEGPLRTGFWFNEMQPGQRTTLHSHDDDDELMSAVYYVTAPQNCGRLLFHQDPATLSITPDAGMLVL
ncbi:MAG: hypothetical protein ABFS23_00815, partial [Pseudomonadota bacterium]